MCTARWIRLPVDHTRGTKHTEPSSSRRRVDQYLQPSIRPTDGPTSRHGASIVHGPASHPVFLSLSLARPAVQSIAYALCRATQRTTAFAAAPGEANGRSNERTNERIYAVMVIKHRPHIKMLQRRVTYGRLAGCLSVELLPAPCG